MRQTLILWKALFNQVRVTQFLKYKICESPQNSGCIYTGISTGIIDFFNQQKTDNKRRFEYENPINQHFQFTVDNFHVSNLSLYRILGKIIYIY